MLCAYGSNLAVGFAALGRTKALATGGPGSTIALASYDRRRSVCYRRQKISSVMDFEASFEAAGIASGWT